MPAPTHHGLSALVPLPDSLATEAVLEPLAGHPPLLRVVRSVCEAVPQHAVVVAAAERFVADVGNLLAGADLAAVEVVSVGELATRDRCLLTGLNHLSERAIRHVLVHDARQPLTSDEVRDRVIAGLEAGGEVVLPVLAVTDSVKAVDEHGAVTATLDRSTLQTVQFPRGFVVDELIDLLTAGEDDEADAAVRAGLPVTVVDGDAEAFLVDLPRDSRFVEAVIGSRPR